MPSPRHAAPTPRRQASPHRPRLIRFAFAAAGLGLAAMVAIPALEQVSRPEVVHGPPPAHAAAAEQPSATEAIQPPAAAQPSPSPAAVNRGPVGSTIRAAVINAGIPPSRLAAELTGTTAPSVDLLTGYRWPLAHPRLTLPFGPTPWGTRVVNGDLFHDGIDIATFCGDHVRAAHDGIVLAAGRHFDDLIGWVGDLGPYYRRLDRRQAWMTLPIIVVVDDGNGYRSMYAHFSQVVVHRGQRVKAGQLLGYEGATGHASGCHVHYGLYSPWERQTFRIQADVVRRMKVPALEIARIDPQRVLPPLPRWHPKPGTPAADGG